MNWTDRRTNNTNARALKAANAPKSTKQNKRPVEKITGVKSKGFKNPRPQTNEWSHSGNAYANNNAAGKGSENARTMGTPAKGSGWDASPKNDGFMVIKPGSKPRTKGKSQ